MRWICTEIDSKLESYHLGHSWVAGVAGRDFRVRSKNRVVETSLEPCQSTQQDFESQSIVSSDPLPSDFGSTSEIAHFRERSKNRIVKTFAQNWPKIT